jgi:ABC-type nitrate/sulfonate/bicarbonate transport system substrate-binding protein
MIKCWMTAVAVACLVALAGAASAQEGAPGTAQAKVTLRYGQIANSARSVSSLALYTAQRKGFFTRENIDLQIVGLRGVHHMIEALDDGRVDVSHTATPYLIQGVLKGSQAVAIVGGPANTIFSLIAKPTIKTFDDLKEKVIGLSLPVDTITIASRMLLAKHGLREPAFTTRELIGTPIRAACLTDGQCDAVPLGQPDDIIFAQKGYTKLGDSLEVIPVLQFNVIAARRDWAAKNKDVATRFARAFGSAYKFMRDPANRDEVAKIAVETTGAPPDVARSMLAFYYEPDRGVMPKQAEISMPGMAKVIELLGQTGDLRAPLPKPEQFVDLQYLHAAGLQ